MKATMSRVAVPCLLAALFMATAVSAAPYGPRHQRVFDQRYGHNHYYPVRGQYVTRLPPRYTTVHFRGSAYYRTGGVWYRPAGRRFVIAAPPIGITVPVLPRFYTTVWFAGAPYYYADQTYYRWVPQQKVYVVSEPPGAPEDGVASAPDSGNRFVYPTRNQSETQQTEDRYACYQWATQQTGFDPTQPLGGVPAQQAASRRGDYQQAEGACLEGRGYTIR